MFNSQFVFPMSIPDAAQPDGKKRCRLRFPTDAEWCERAKKSKVISRDLGRGKRKTSSPAAGAATFELFNKVREDTGGPGFDEAEATALIAKLERADLVDIECGGGQYVVTVIVAGGFETKHFLAIPTMKDVIEYGEASIASDPDRRGMTLTFRLEPAAEFYKRLAKKWTGYIDGQDPPIIHKEAVLSHIVSEFRDAVEDDCDPEL